MNLKRKAVTADDRAAANKKRRDASASERLAPAPGGDAVMPAPSGAAVDAGAPAPAEPARPPPQPSELPSLSVPSHMHNAPQLQRVQKWVVRRCFVKANVNGDVLQPLHVYGLAGGPGDVAPPGWIQKDADGSTQIKLHVGSLVSQTMHVQSRLR